MAHLPPAVPSVEGAREWFSKQAKELLLAYRKGDAEAAQRVRAVYTTPRTPDTFPLGHAQHVVVVEKGYANWCDMLDKLNARRVRPVVFDGLEGVEPVLDWTKKCIVCGAKPVWPMTEMCGPCSIGESATAGDNW